MSGLLNSVQLHILFCIPFYFFTLPTCLAYDLFFENLLQQQRMKIIIIILVISLSQQISERKTLPEGFSYLQQIDPSILIQARYAIPQNFVGQIVKGYLSPTVIITTKAALVLKEVQSIFRELGYSLVVYDAYRPQKAVDNFVSWTLQPEDNKTKLQFYPYIEKDNIIPDYVGKKSGHTRGSTVDLTIIRLDKSIHDVKLVDYKLRDGRIIKYRDDGTQFMCGHFDLFDLASHHDSKLINEECMEKRNMLRDIMVKNGFRFLQQEWWHYTLQNQPFPATYFDFNVE